GRRILGGSGGAWSWGPLSGDALGARRASTFSLTSVAAEGSRESASSAHSSRSRTLSVTIIASPTELDPGGVSLHDTPRDLFLSRPMGRATGKGMERGNLSCCILHPYLFYLR